jgi:hypothetical protein
MASSNTTLMRCVERLRQSEIRLQHDMVGLGQPLMPTQPDRAPTTPPYHCPQCLQALSLHNTRVDVTADKAERVDVYFCIKHGFYRATDKGPLTPGM